MQTQTKFVKHEACDSCGSSDAKAVYSDASAYCFNCKTYFKASDGLAASTEGKVLPMTNKAVTGQIRPISAYFGSIPERGITKATCEAYGVMQTGIEHYYPFTDARGTEVAYKIRVVPDKQFRSQGNIKDALLFGQAMWNKGGKYVTIVEGELDALAAYQMMGSKYPVVSIKNQLLIFSLINLYLP